MLNLIYCEITKLKRSKIVLISLLGVLATPLMMFTECIQNHFKYPERIFTLSDVYDDSLLYVMLLTNMMVYVAITAYLFSREYSENTLKTILPIPVSRTRLLVSKFLTLLLWIIILTIVTWIGILILSGVYNMIFGMSGFGIFAAFKWLIKFLAGNILIFVTMSPFAYIAQRSRGFVAPVIAAAVVVMGNAALSNQDVGMLYPWTAIFFIIKGKTGSTGYPVSLAAAIIFIVSLVSFFITFNYFRKEDLK